MLHKSITWLTYIVVIGAIFISATDYGLFSDSEFYKWHIYFGVIFIAYLSYRIIVSTEFNVITILMFSISLIYLLSFITAASPEGNFTEFFRYITYAALFALLLDLQTSNKSIKLSLPYLFILFGIYLMIVPFLSLSGNLEFRDAVLGNRFSGFFQYPNVYGAVGMSFFLFSTSLILKRTSWINIVIYSLPLVLFASSLFLSQSRAAFLLFPMIWMLGLFLIKLHDQFKYILVSLTSFGFAGLLYIKMSPIPRNEIMTGFWDQLIVYSLISLIIVITLVTLINKFIHIKSDKKIYNFIIPTGITALGAAFLIDILFKGKIYSSLPENLQSSFSRISRLEKQDLTSDRRFDFYSDALKMFSDSPLIGWGGDSWPTLYYVYQSFPYIGNDVHSYLFEQLLNVGGIGILVLLATLVFIFIKLLKNVNNKAVFGSLMGAVMLIAHASVDFDLSFGTAWFILILLFVLGLNNSGVSSNKFIITNTKKKLLITIPILAVVAFSTLYSTRFLLAEKAINDVRGQDLNVEKTMEVYEKAHNYNPYDIDTMIQLAAIYVEQDKEEKVYEIANSIYETEPKNPRAVMQVGNAYASYGEIENALKYYNKSLKLDEYNIDVYSRAIRLTSSEAVNWMQLGVLKKAQDMAEKTVQYYNQHQEMKNSIEPKSNLRDTKLSKSSLFLTAQAFAINEQDEDVIQVTNRFKGKEDIDLRAKALKYLSLGRLNKTKQQEELYNGQENQKQFDQYIKAYKRAIYK
ncbi:O-antigen ligase family protein [Filobacillus milosensis]|nr:O-antigen ligase family protein [Filobacillus milosensis]